MFHIHIFSSSLFQHSLQANFPPGKTQIVFIYCPNDQKGEALVQFSSNMDLAKVFRSHNMPAVNYAAERFFTD